MKPFISAFICVFGFLIPAARADMFGGDNIILAQILQQSVSQLAQLKNIMQAGTDSLNLVRDINRGINDSLRAAESLGLHIDPGIYRKLDNVDQAFSTVERVFGKTVNSPVATVERNTDRVVAEAISFNNRLNDYTLTLDRIGEDIKSFSHVVSPGGAMKLTAQSLGVVIHVMDQQLRTQGQALKLQAQAMAIQNKKDKDQTEQFIKEGQQLKNRMMTADLKFEAPRF